MTRRSGRSSDSRTVFARALGSPLTGTVPSPSTGRRFARGRRSRDQCHQLCESRKDESLRNRTGLRSDPGPIRAIPESTPLRIRSRITIKLESVGRTEVDTGDARMTPPLVLAATFSFERFVGSCFALRFAFGLAAPGLRSTSRCPLAPSPYGTRLKYLPTDSRGTKRRTYCPMLAWPACMG